MTEQEAMELALDEAKRALASGDVPVGAVVLRDGEVIATGHNEREAGNDATAHAELIAIRNACAATGEWRLTNTTLVVTLEPCIMCAGAIVAARIPKVAFGAVDPKAGATGSLYNLLSDPRLNHEAEVQSGVMAEQSAELLKTFFAERRKAATEL